MELLDYGKFNVVRLSTDISLVEDQFKTEGEYWLFGVVRLWYDR